MDFTIQDSSGTHAVSGLCFVEDISRYPMVIDKIVEHTSKGGLVPDFEMQHAGCSKRKRKASGASRLYTPSPEVAAIAAERRNALHAQARSMLSPVVE